MPIIENSTYEPPIFFRNNHLSTLHASLVRKLEPLPYQRTRIDTKDGDFIDLDIASAKNKRAVLLLHGLEGDSSRNYMVGMATKFHNNEWDAVAMNFRGCSGEPNRLPRSYHVGETSDLDDVIQYLFNQKMYESIALVGFSMGGNMILKYLGEENSNLDPRIKAAVTFSVPCDIPTANIVIEKWYNWHYRQYLVRSLHEKFKIKIGLYPELLSIPKTNWTKTFRSFDEHYTAPIHGFKSAMDYWTINSSIHFLSEINVPTLLVNAIDDTFLSDECFPRHIAKEHDYLHLESPEFGGHIGFAGADDNGSYWSERRALEFVSQFT